MNLSKETIAIMLTIAIAVGGGAWAIRDMISSVQVEVKANRKEIQANREEIQAVREEIKLNRLYTAHHRHHDTGEVYYERGIVRGTGAGANNTPGTSASTNNTRDIASASNETEIKPRE